MENINDPNNQQSLSIKAARKLATTTKTLPQMESISPRWFCQLLPWVNVAAGTYRVNKRKIIVKRDGRIDIELKDGEVQLEPRHLRAISLLRDADESLINSMLPCFVKEEYKTGDTIIKEGDKEDKFSILALGKVEFSIINPSGKKCTLKIKAAGEYFGEIAPTEAPQPAAAVRALEPSFLLSLERTRFDKLLKDASKLQEELDRLTQERRDALARSNKYGEKEIKMLSGHVGEPDIPETFVDYIDEPREYPLSLVQTVLKIHTRVKELYDVPIDQLAEQLRLTTLEMKERKEWEMINNPEFGLLNQVAPSMRVQTRGGPPTPDDMDDLLAKVWKKPAYFLAHPKAIAAFGRECTRRGVPPATVMILGSPFITWRGVPIIPCEKLEVRDRSRYGHSVSSTNILLLRVGEKDQGVVGLRDDALNSEYGHSLTVQLMGIDNKAIASYLLSMYFSIAVLTEDALGVLENVDTGFYHEYDCQSKT